MKPKRKRGRKAKLTFKKEIDGVKICKQGSEKVFILPRAMTGENYQEFKEDNRIKIGRASCRERV